MIQQLMALLPDRIDGVAVVVAMAGAFLGLVLWIAGARFSRTLVTLISVAAGVLVGMRLPGWFGWPLEGWSTATLGALVLGISGYAGHKVWVGAGLGIVLACWAGLAVFVVYSTGADGGSAKVWAWPPLTPGETVQQYATTAWSSLRLEVRQVLPFACAAALVTGLTVSVVWPRLGVVLLYSCAGLSLLIGLGVAAVSVAQPQWLKAIPNQTSSQVIMLLSLVAFGAVMQWRVAPQPRRY
ncbi:MAG: hypothetical protein ACAI43_21825 [Phycisphaerae bacterium]